MSCQTSVSVSVTCQSPTSVVPSCQTAVSVTTRCLLPKMTNPTILNINNTQSSNTGTAETVLSTYTLPGGLLTTDGDSLRVSVYLKVANSNAKTVIVHFGAAYMYFAITSTSVAGFLIQGIITRTSATTQKLSGISVSPDVAWVDSNGAETLANDIVIKTTVESTATGNVTHLYTLIELLPTP